MDFALFDNTKIRNLIGKRTGYAYLTSKTPDICNMLKNKYYNGEFKNCELKTIDGEERLIFKGVDNYDNNN